VVPGPDGVVGTADDPGTTLTYWDYPAQYQGVQTYWDHPGLVPALGLSHARIWADLRARGEMIGAHDLLIAATALAHQLTIATRNERHFRRVEALPVVCW
jgi:hypothetical protein